MERASSQQVAIAVAAAVGAASALFLRLRSRRIAEARHELLALAETPTKTAPDSSDTPTKRATPQMCTYCTAVGSRSELLRC